MLYIISDPLNENVFRYKVGSHSGNRDQLISRYITALPELNIHYCSEIVTAYEIEQKLKQCQEAKRIRMEDFLSGIK